MQALLQKRLPNRYREQALSHPLLCSICYYLTELFLELKTDKTPAVVERIVSDIDAIVNIVRFPGWQNSVAGEREVQKSLRKTLLKYQLHKEEELFEKAYLYIKEYY